MVDNTRFIHETERILCEYKKSFTHWMKIKHILYTAVSHKED